MPDKEVLISDNEKLKVQLQEAIDSANQLKETLETQMSEKEIKTNKIEEELRNDIKTKMEDIVRINLK